MARKFSQGKFYPTRPEKYVGKNTPMYRSSWELTMMQFCDNNPAVVSWASESITIPYKNPFTNRHTIYVPDFFIVYMDKNGKRHAELIEIKPHGQTSMEAAGRSQRNKAAAALNEIKWRAARAWCKQNGIRFRIVTENDIFHTGAK